MPTKPEMVINPMDLLYSGGLNWYLESLVKAQLPQKQTPTTYVQLLKETIHTLPPTHPRKEIVGEVILEELTV